MFLLWFCYYFIVLVLSNTTKGSTIRKCNVLSKSEWGGKIPKEVEYQIFPVKYVIINHTTSQTCSTFLECSEYVKNIEHYHMDVLKWHDIGYNFLIGNDGNVYEGAGWHKIGAHTLRYNSKSIGIGFIGDFTNELPSNAALQAAKDLLECGVQNKELDENYILLGARQVVATQSPGVTLYNEIQTWGHWQTI